jgi:hypothetical protein
MKTFLLTPTARLKIMSSRKKDGIQTGQWVATTDGSLGRLVLSPMVKGLTNGPRKIAVVHWSHNESFKQNNERFYRAVSYTK